MEQGTQPIRVLIADAQSLVREALRAALEQHAGIDVVAEASDGVQAVAQADRVRPDVAVLDAELPNQDAVRTTRLVRARVSTCRVVVLSDDEDDRTLAAVVEAGASGFVARRSSLSSLVDTVRAVHDGDTLVPPRMLGALLQRLIHRGREKEAAIRRVSRLSDRERQVLGLLVDGANNERIAQALVISPETARTHVQHVLNKLGMHSRLAAAAYVTTHGLADELTLVDA